MQVSEIIVHENYGSSDYDVAVMKVLYCKLYCIYFTQFFFKIFLFFIDFNTQIEYI